MFKKVFIAIAAMGLLSSCVSVRFPNELNIRVSFPEHMSTGEIDHMIRRIPSKIDYPHGSMKVHVFKNKDSIKYGAKEFLFISDDGQVTMKNDSTNLFVIKEKKN